MKSLWIVIFGAIGIAVAYVLSGKKTSAAGGCIPATFVGPLTPQQTSLPKCGDSSGSKVTQIAQNGGQLWDIDQKTMNAQPDFSGGPSKPILPANIFNPPIPEPPSDLIGSSGGIAGTASGLTFPASIPPPPGNSDIAPIKDLSPTFWAADSVPPNPYLDNGLTGPTYTA